MSRYSKKNEHDQHVSTGEYIEQNRINADRRDSFARPALLAALVISLYWPTLFYNFVNYDDLDTVTSNPFIRDISLDGIVRILTHFSLQSYYPMRLLSIAADYSIWGSNPHGYHLTNSLIHLSSTLLVYALFIRLAGAKGTVGADGRRLAFWAAAFFGLHPATVDSVAWVAGREELLMLFFLLCAIHMGLCARKAEGAEKLLLYVLAAYSAIFSCLSNVLGVTIAPLALAVEALIFGERRPLRLLARTWHLWLIALATFFIKLVSLGVYDQSTQSILFPYVPQALKNAGFLIGKSYIAQAATLDVVERTRLVVSLFGANFFQVFFPLRLPVMYENHLPASFASPDFLMGCLAIFLLASILWLTRKKPLAFFGLAWFLICLMPSAQIIPHHIYRAERFLYLPLVGFSLFAASVFLCPAYSGWRRFFPSILAVWMTALSARAATHLPVWSDAINLHTYCVAQTPEYFQVHRYLGVELARLGRFDEAIPVLKNAVRLAPERNDLWMVTYKAYMASGRLDEAEVFAREGTAKDPKDYNRWGHLGLILAYHGKFDEAEKAFKKALSLAPTNDVLHFNLGSLLAEQGRSGEAMHELTEAVRLNPQNGIALYSVGQELEKAGAIGEAIEKYRLAAKWAPGYLPPHRRLKELLHQETPEQGNDLPGAGIAP